MAEEAIAVVPYDPAWARQFAAERVRLEDALAPWLDGGVHHVGSTAVPGLAAKAIIDMVAGVRSLGQARAAFESLEALSYVHAPHRPNIAHHFAKPSPLLGKCRFSLHLTEPGSDLWQERLAFRDALVRDRSLARRYERLKLELAARYPYELDAYTKGKRELVVEVLAASGERLGRR